MSGKVIQCFNDQECTYEKCSIFSPEMDTCKMELFKTHTKEAKPQRTIPTPKEVVQHAAEHVEGTRQINTLKEGEKSDKENKINIKGFVAFDPEENERDTSHGPSTVTSIVVKDGSGEAKISFWGDSHGGILELVKGDHVFFEGLYRVKAPYKDTIQIDGGKYYKVAKLN